MYRQVGEFERTDKLAGGGEVQRKRDHRERAFQWTRPPGPARLSEIQGLRIRGASYNFV